MTVSSQRFQSPAIPGRFTLNGKNEDLPIQVRISVHEGPCVAVNLNTAIDYFGTTVNTVSKLQIAVGASQIALTNDIVTDTALKEFMHAHGYSFKNPQMIDLSGIGPIQYWKIVVKHRKAT
jgi:class 3 adenylate cyclase